MKTLLKIDLQLFAEEAAATDTQENNDETSSVNNEDVTKPKQPEEEHTSENKVETEDPFEISDEIKRLVAQENNIALEEEKSAEETKEPAETTENKPTKAEEKEETAPPDYKKLYEELLAKQQTQQQAQQTVHKTEPQADINQIVGNNLANNAPAQMPNSSLLANIKITPELSKAIEDMAFNRAVQMTGMTQDALDALEYAEDDDANKKQFETAKAIAKSAVMNDLNNRFMQMQQQVQAQAKQQQENIKDMQAFSQEIMQVENYQDICNYATGEFIKTLPPAHQQAIRDAYIRADRGTNSVQDNMILRSFWKAGLNAYNNAHAMQTQPKQNQAATTNTEKINNKMTQRNKMPRVAQLNSSGDANKNLWTLDKINSMIDKGQFNEIPREIVEQVMEGTLQ